MKKIAYLIIAHKDPLHLNKLISSLDYNSDFYIHIDFKSNIKEFTSIIDMPNVFFLTERINIHWADISMVDATLNLIKFTLNTNKQYERITLISGFCYPIKSSKYIYDFLTSDSKHEYIKYFDMKNNYSHFCFVKNKWFKKPFYMGNKIYIIYLDKLFRRILNLLRLKSSWNINGLTPYFGSQWWSLTLPCCEYIFNYVSSNPSFYNQYKYSFSPDEHFFHTIIGNSHFSKFSDGEIKYLKNKGVDGYYLTNLHYTDPSLSKWFTEKDLSKIISSKKLFVRKICSNSGSELVSKLDKFKD
jgi:hypothetical protein